MPALEAIAYVLGTAIAKTACGLWAGNNEFGKELGNSVIDRIAGQLPSSKQQRRFRQIWTETADVVSDSIESLIETEFPDVPAHEREAAALAVSKTFESATLSEEDLFRRDLDAGFLDRFLRSKDPDRAAQALLSDGGSRLYDRLLRESCAYAIEVVRTLPRGNMIALSELLSRSRQILDELAEVLRRLPTLRAGVDFERDYRQLVANRLDQIELYGATLSEGSKRYPLSVAYLSLNVGSHIINSVEPMSDCEVPVATAAAGELFRIERLLASSDRIFIRGHAGIGKTTLLQWIAVNSARRSFPPDLASWNGTVPFVVTLRRYAAEDLPTPQSFLREVGRHIADEMPAGWVQTHLRSGQAVVLVDGIDELPEGRRRQARSWIAELVSTFPSSRYIVTSRPGAVPAEWLGDEDFTVAELAPMERNDISVFVRRWHEAMRGQARTDAQRDQISAYERRLNEALDQNRHLRQLARYPLLCALTCALHQDRRGQLPSSRMELYEVALHMLLERRDEEREIKAINTLSRTQKTLLLQDLAYWLIRNGQSDAPRETAIERIHNRINKMPRADIGPEDAYKVLLERSGLLREPVYNRADFVHRTFQEYLAAKEAVNENDIGVLVINAHLDQWQETIVMAAGHAGPAARRTLLEGILDRGSRDSEGIEVQTALHLLALACLETSPECEPDIQERVLAATAGLLPPASGEAAEALARAGALSLDLLMQSPITDERDAALTIRTLALIGDAAAIPFMASRFGTDSRSLVVASLLMAWEYFDPDDFARKVLADSPLEHNGHASVTSLELLPAARHLKNLKALVVGDRNRTDSVDLAFLETLPSLISLSVPYSQDLSPVARTSLKFLAVTGGYREDLVVDVGPLGLNQNLASVHLPHCNVSNIDALGRLPRLESLGLSSAALETLTARFDLPALRRLQIVVKSPDMAFTHKCIGQIMELRLTVETPTDLTFLRNSSRLSTLSITSREDIDLTLVPQLPDLRRLELALWAPENVNRALPWVSKMTGLRRLELHTFARGVVDLSPLHGMEQLLVVLHGARYVDYRGKEGIADLRVVN